MKQVDNKKKKLKFVGIYKYEAPERLLYILLRKWGGAVGMVVWRGGDLLECAAKKRCWRDGSRLKTGGRSGTGCGGGGRSEVAGAGE
ncbi:hypothetical protein GYH30_047006 [Glycine max]|nr:hypothetical protein GYH30_047006 [Glycine max]